MNRAMKYLSSAMLAVAVTLGFSASALAASYASGVIQHINGLGNFCPDIAERDCGNSKYPQSDFGKALPISKVKVYVRNQNDDILGQGLTAANGGFQIPWTWSSGPAPTKIRITWHLEHGDNRYRLLRNDGTSYRMHTGDFTPVVGGTTAIGIQTWGSAGAPNGRANHYAAAYRTYKDSLDLSNRFYSYFTGIRGYIDSAKCPTSCAAGETKELWLDVNSAFTPQERMMHELGHIASEISYVSFNHWAMADYCYPSTGSGCGWNLTSPEWKSMQMEEAVASFYAAVALYKQGAMSPHTCLAAPGAACPTGAFRIAGHDFCTGDVPRRQLSALRGLWDVYDTVADVGGSGWDSVSASIEQIVDAFTAFPNGRSDHQVNEGWGCFVLEEEGACWPSDRDGQNMQDFKYHLLNTSGLDATVALSHGCQ